MGTDESPIVRAPPFCLCAGDFLFSGARAGVEAQKAAEGALELRTHVRAAGERAEVALSVRNRSPRPIAIERLFPLVVETRAGGALRRAGGPCVLAEPDSCARALRVGYSNAVPPVPLGPRDREDRATTHPLLLRLLPRALLDVAFDPAAPPESTPGRVTSAWVSVLRDRPGAPALAMGFASFRAQFGRVRLAFGPREGSLRAELAMDGALLGPGEEVRAEPLLLFAAPTPERALALWADEVGRRNGARPRPLRYWCTWYAAPGDRIDERFVLGCAAALARRRARLDFVLVDDGWQRALGDWLETNGRFPRGLAALAGSIRAAGFRPALWLAPFAVSPRSRVFEKHPDWVVRRPGGGPRAAGVVFGLRGLPRRYFALDLTREDVREHLAAVFAALRRAGFDAFKVDFLTAGAIPGERADPGRTRAEAYARGMAAIRQGAGDDAAILGAIAPFVANVGHVDSQRVGTDVAFGRPRFRTPLARALGDRMTPCVENALAGPLALAALDGRLFANDGDCAVARGLPPRLARALVRASLAACGANGLGDDPRQGPGDAIDLFAALERAGERPGGARVLDLLDRDIPERLLVREAGGTERIETFEWGRFR